MFLSDLISFIQENRYKGRREAFGFEGAELRTYVIWAFCFNYLFVVSDEKVISGVGIAYPLANPFDGRNDSLLSFSNPVKFSEESRHELCIMDWAANSPDARRRLVAMFKQRFPFWESQKKWAIQFEKPKEITNEYINLLTI